MGEAYRGVLFPVLYPGERSLGGVYSLFYTLGGGLSVGLFPVLYPGSRLPGGFIPCFIPWEEPPGWDILP